MKRITLTFICFSCVWLVLTGCKKTVTQNEIDQFINSKNLEQVSIQKLSDDEYYIFSSPYVYIYRGSSGYVKSSGLVKEKIVIGGLQKGSIGLIINNLRVLREAKTYSIIIDGKTREYEYHGEKYLIIKDHRIWNPTAQLKIIFLSDQNEKIFETEY
ncbi:hypothetical protein [Paenibacillus glufosinatiresistens]|uniref:hypothetical protein n=1 Tax=Paenibacillus glufosinatiresistens TaxID=3070657 RepID=UPI00286DA304|nr:hypothetical protein [Paenibacillus sp. YX.27]